MDYFSVVLALIVLSGSLADECCPPANDIKPCTCDFEGLNCMSATSTDQIRKAFKANFKCGGILSVWIQGTPITNIPSDLFSTVPGLHFYLEMNKITSVGKLEAFSPSKKLCRILSFFGNQLTDFPYSSLQDFQSLQVLNLGRNSFTSIPANAISHKTLTKVMFPQNSISSIGRNAFKNLPMLESLDFTSNKMSVLGDFSISLTTNNPMLQVILVDNEISSVSNTAFDGTTPQVLKLDSNRLASLPQGAFNLLCNRIYQSGGVITIYGNPFTCRGCDYKWLMQSSTAYNRVLAGFMCPDGTGILDLTSSKIGC